MSLSTLPRRAVPLLVALPAVLALSACGSTPVELSPEQLEASLLSPEELPFRAEGDTWSDASVDLEPENLGLDHTAGSVTEDCAAALAGVYPGAGEQAHTAVGDYATGEQRVFLRLLSHTGDSGLDLAEGFTAVARSCDGQTPTTPEGLGITLHALEEGHEAGFRQEIADLPELFAALGDRLETHRLVHQEGNNSVELLGVGLTEAEAQQILADQAARLQDTVAAAR